VWAFALIAILLLTWPLGLGRLTAKVVCRPSAIGLKVFRQVDAQSTGYYLAGVTLEDSKHTGGYGYTRQAAWDLLNGRIAFFEMDAGTPGRFHRFSFAPDSSANCVTNTGSAFAGLTPPLGQCLARVEDSSLRSLYQLDGFETGGGFRRRTAELRVRSTRELVATFVIHRVPYMRLGSIHGGDTSTDLVCPKVEYNPAMGDELLYFSPEHALTAFAMRDRNDKVTDLAALLRGEKSEFHALPTRAAEAQFGSCSLPALPVNTELHRFWREKPALRQKRSLYEPDLDREVLEIQVDRPGVPVVLLLQSRAAIRWKIIETKGTRIAAVLVSSESGAINIDRQVAEYYEVPMLVHSPVTGGPTNCNREMFARAIDALAGVPSMAEVASAASPAGAWPLSGEPIVIKEARTPEEKGEPLPPPPPPPADPYHVFDVAELLASGAMRKLTEDDIRLFLRDRRPYIRTFDGGQEPLKSVNPGSDFIVLRDIHIPTQSAARELRYIVPRGVPEPAFAGGHVIAFVDATCDAQECRP